MLSFRAQSARPGALQARASRQTCVRVCAKVSKRDDEPRIVRGKAFVTRDVSGPGPRRRSLADPADPDGGGGGTYLACWAEDSTHTAHTAARHSESHSARCCPAAQCRTLTRIRSSLPSTSRSSPQRCVARRAKSTTTKAHTCTHAWGRESWQGPRPPPPASARSARPDVSHASLGWKWQP